MPIFNILIHYLLLLTINVNINKTNKLKNKENFTPFKKTNLDIWNKVMQQFVTNFNNFSLN